MALLQQVEVFSQPLERFVPVTGEAAVREALGAAERLRHLMAGRRLWAVNSTRVGGGVAEMLRPLLAYARGAAIDARWLVIDGDRDFFRITKRIHNALHGERGDGSPLGAAERAQYEHVLRLNAEAVLTGTQASRGDLVLLHDPQTAGLAPPLAQAGLHVIWRCHIGSELSNAETERGWRFLQPYLTAAEALVFSRLAYVPRGLASMASIIIPPSIDPFSAKNQPLPEAVVYDVLASTGLAGHDGRQNVAYDRPDGTRGEIRHAADVMRLGSAPPFDVPLVVQVSRWDTLKDPLGVMQGFAGLAAAGGASNAELLLCGPNVVAVADDPDGARVFEQVVGAWRALPHEIRRRITLASLPVHDVDENAIIVNALQRHAAVIVQKSLREGFGLTVTEAMWKSRPVVASRVGGIVDQIVDGESGLLLDDPSDLTAFGRLVSRVLADRELAGRLGASARQRVREGFLGLRHLLQYAELFAQILKPGSHARSA
jgi:trehalose synthase